MVEIITNNVPRDVIDGSELTEDERKEFDYIDWATEYEETFFRYKGTLYDINEFIPAYTTETLGEWDGYHSDTYFSGILVKWVQDSGMEQIIVGRFYVE